MLRQKQEAEVEEEEEGDHREVLEVVVVEVVVEEEGQEEVGNEDGAVISVLSLNVSICVVGYWNAQQNEYYYLLILPEVTLNNSQYLLSKYGRI